MASATPSAASSPASGPKRPRTSRGASRRSVQSMQRTEVKINVYDLLPPSKLSTVLWTMGTAILHSGVVVKDREYAYGGHNVRDKTGVYFTRPRHEPPGGTYRCEYIQGLTYSSQAEVEEVIKQVSHAFQGTQYNLLTKNCNHFTSHLVEKLTGRPAPAWLNRAATIGFALPCVVPREWLAPPDYETADGELVDEEHEDDERTAMLRKESFRRPTFGSSRVSSDQEDAWSYETGRIERMAGRRSESVASSRRSDPNGKGKAAVRDTGGRALPASERAPVPSRSRAG